MHVSHTFGGYVLRQAQSDDAAEVALLCATVRISTYSNMFSDERLSRYIASQEVTERKIQRFKKRFGDDSPNRINVVATINNVVVGYHTCILNNEENSVRLKGLFVHADHQGKGLGGKLMTCLLDQLPGREVTLQVLAANTRAIAMYEKFGFTASNKSVEDYHGLSRLEMVLLT